MAKKFDLSAWAKESRAHIAAQPAKGLACNCWHDARIENIVPPQKAPSPVTQTGNRKK
jgi:hypothetical protein